MAPLICQVWRIVESQVQIATVEISDSLEEQDFIESLLEKSKPGSINTQYSYLLTTPFRYPPLKYGSRFGDRYSPSLFYASADRTTAMFETAYYRFVFIAGMDTPFQGSLSSQHSLFKVGVSTTKGLDLTAPPFNEEPSISDPADYRESQALGQIMRGAGVHALRFFSAKDPRPGVNIALFTLEAFSSKRPVQQESMSCLTTPDKVVFTLGKRVFSLPRETFLVDGVFPSPAI